MKNLLSFILKSAIIVVLFTICTSHMLSNLQIQHVDAHSGKIIDVYNVVECYTFGIEPFGSYNILDFSK